MILQAIANYINAMADKVRADAFKARCAHAWTIHETVDVYGRNEYGGVTSKPIETKQTLMCSACGAVKRISL